MSDQTHTHPLVPPPLPSSQPPSHVQPPSKKSRMGWIVAGSILGVVALIIVLIVIVFNSINREISSIFTDISSQIPQSNPDLSIIPPTVDVVPTAERMPTESNLYPITVDTYGHSVTGRPLESTCVGNGSHVLVLAAGLHGDQKSPRQFVDAIRKQFEFEPTLLPPGSMICFIININPDGAVTNSRFNAHTIDLNRNWDTNDWVSDIERGSGIMEGGGGAYQQSEPEVRRLVDYLYDLEASGTAELVFISYQSTVTSNSSVRPGYRWVGEVEKWDGNSVDLAQKFARSVGYVYSTSYAYHLTGESLHWMVDHGIAVFGIEMPNNGVFDSGTIQTHIYAILALLIEWQ